MSFLDRWFYNQSSRSAGTGNLNTGKLAGGTAMNISAREKVTGYVPSEPTGQNEPNLRNVPYKYYRETAIEVPIDQSEIKPVSIPNKKKKASIKKGNNIKAPTTKSNSLPTGSSPPQKPIASFSSAGTASGIMGNLFGSRRSSEVERRGSDVSDLMGSRKGSIVDSDDGKS